MDVKIKPKKHLINILKDTRDHHPNFTLLLGAGASVTCGVKTSREMIIEWRGKYRSLYPDIEQETWYDRPEEYSFLFEHLYDQPSQRREYIETCLKKAKPSWGYIYLVNLIRNDVFNTIFTTNFDDLLNEACYSFSSDVRPLVCAHDSSVRFLRITSHRPKIIKLHGDYLFDDIKNTTRELESLEVNMRDKFKQYAPEYGMILVGYAGNDRSVMDTLSTLLRSDSNFPHGIYWCVKDEKNIPASVKNLCRFPKFQLVSIEGFDELFAEINDALDLALQPEMVDPYKAVSERLNALLKNAGIPDEPDKIHPVIKRDVEILADRIKRNTTEKHLSAEKTVIKNDGLSTNPPYQLLADTSYRSGNFDEAKAFIKLQLATEPNSSAYRLALKILKRNQDPDFLGYIFDSLKQHSPSFDFNDNNNMALDLIESEHYEVADYVLNIADDNLKKEKAYPGYYKDFLFINKMQIKKHRKQSLSVEEKNFLIKIADSSDKMTQIGCYIVLEEYNKAIKLLDDIAEDYMFDWPIMKLFPQLYQPELDKIKTRVTKH